MSLLNRPIPLDFLTWQPLESDAMQAYATACGAAIPFAKEMPEFKDHDAFAPEISGRFLRRAPTCSPLHRMILCTLSMLKSHRRTEFPVSFRLFSM